MVCRMKKIFIFLITLILFLSISAICAEDNSTSQLSQDIVEEKTFDAIQTSIDNAKESDTIVLDGTYYGSGNPISIDKPITIEGKTSSRLDAKSSSQIFKINSDNVVLKNMVFANGVIDDIVSNNYGGAINSNGNNLKILNCNFTSNSASFGGALYSSGDNVSIGNCQFVNNKVDYTGGAFELDGDDNCVDGCIFKDNVAGHAGGAVAWVGDNGILTNSAFTNFNVASGRYAQYGGAIVWMGSNGQIIKSSFTKFSAKRFGAAIYWKGENGSVTYSIFENDTSENDHAYWGNSSYVNHNYWGLSMNSSEEFITQKLIYFSDFDSPENWVNVVKEGYNIAFKDNSGEKLSDYMPEYKLNSTVTIVKNTFDTRKNTKLAGSDIVTYCLYNGKYLKITLSDADGNKLNSKKVQIKLNGITYSRTTNSQGVVSLQINLKKSGTYSASVLFDGGDEFKSTSKAVKVTVKKQKPTLAIQTKTLKLKSKTKIIRVAFKSQFKKPISKASVKITINKKTYTAKTNSKGIASFKVSLKTKKTYKVTAKFLGNGYYNKVSKTAAIKLK